MKITSKHLKITSKHLYPMRTVTGLNYKSPWSGTINKIRMAKLNNIFKLTITKEPKTLITTYENL